MRGEDDPTSAAAEYGDEVRPVVEAGVDLVLLGMGADAHICAMFPGSLALDVTDELCRAVDRPDGMQGLTLTPPAVLSGRKIAVIVTGSGKAEAVRRVFHGTETPAQCPARLLAQHPDVTFLLDEPAAAHL
jgi:6-phosphogluconolactonase